MSKSKTHQIRPVRIALVGNPNTGKTSLFNELCGVRQKTGNYPGVTVDKKVGRVEVQDWIVDIIDLPGIDSLYPKSKDEELVVNYLLKEENDYDAVVVVLSAINLKRNLFLLEQLKDLELPIIVALNMMDAAKKRGIQIFPKRLEKNFGVEVYPVSAKYGDGIEELTKRFTDFVGKSKESIDFIEYDKLHLIEKFAPLNQSERTYVNFLNLVAPIGKTDSYYLMQRKEFIEQEDIDVGVLRRNEAILRYKKINELLEGCMIFDKKKTKDFTTRLDKILIHPVFGYLIFFSLMFLIFQAIFWFASYPMDLIDKGFAWLSANLSDVMPDGYFSELIVDGVIPGIGGVIIFIPQIAILFFLFSLLDQCGYMSRIVYLSDRFMTKFGMSGKSIIPLISGMACAVPAIMAARTIENDRDRLITILVTPLLTCSARLPVYVILIALIVPDQNYGVFNLQGIALMGMYLLGIIMALIAGIVFRFVLKSTYKPVFLMELPEYLAPDMRDVLIEMWVKVKAFVWNAGRIILATSIILFVLATNGSVNHDKAQQIIERDHPHLTEAEMELEISSYQLEHSFLGMIGKGIEPAIEPLGYDWKMGIAVLSSIAAREVFVGTMSTIYSIDSEDEMTIKERLKTQEHASRSGLAFNLATCISLLLFYAFALQCLSTVAVTYKETGSLKWTAIQFVYMSALAYIAALIAYQVLK